MVPAKRQFGLDVGYQDDVGAFWLADGPMTSTKYGPLFLRAPIARGANQEFCSNSL